MRPTSRIKSMKKISNPVLKDRLEPEHLTDQHYDFEKKMKPKLVSAARSSDLRPFTSGRHDQLNIGSCAAQSVIKAIELLRIKKYGRGAHVDLSRMAVYFLSRELMKPPECHLDEGTYISNCADVMRRFGVCAESIWDYTIDHLYKSPSWAVMRSAYRNKIAGWSMIKSYGNKRVEDVILTLANGLPVCFGTPVGDNWKDYESDSQPLRIPSNETGRHATVLVGYDPTRNIFIGENSWGTGWGHDGFYELMPEVVAWDRSANFVVMTDDPGQIVYE